MDFKALVDVDSMVASDTAELRKHNIQMSAPSY